MLVSLDRNAVKPNSFNSNQPALKPQPTVPASVLSCWTEAQNVPPQNTNVCCGPGAGG